MRVHDVAKLPTRAAVRALILGFCVFRVSFMPDATLAQPAPPDTGPKPNYTELLSFAGTTGGLTFHLNYSKDGNVNLQEYVPEGQTVENWTQMITVLTTKPEHRIEPGGWIVGTVESLKKHCGSVKVFEQHHGTQVDTMRQQQGLPANYQVYSILAVCENPAQAPGPNVTLHRYEAIWFKGIRGWLDDYLVERAWHGDTITPDSLLASRATQDEWRGWINDVSIAGRPK